MNILWLKAPCVILRKSVVVMIDTTKCGRQMDEYQITEEFSR